VKKILSVLLVLLLAGQVIAGPSRSSSSSSSGSSRSSGGFRSSPSSPSPRSSSPSSSSSSRSSGGFRSSPTPPSSPKPTVTYTPKPSSTPKSAASTQATPKPTDRTSGGFKTESSQKADHPKSSLDKTLFNKTKEAGTAKPRPEQIQEFKAKNASKYTSEYKQEPKTRPEHIPQTYTSGGNSYNIVYNPGRGYGYWSGGPGLGTFMLYDAMSDAIMLNALMSRPAVAPVYTPVYGSGGGSEVVVTHSYIPQIFGFLFLVVFIGVVCYVIKNG